MFGLAQEKSAAMAEASARNAATRVGADLCVRPALCRCGSRADTQVGPYDPFSTASSHDECERHAAGSFLHTKHFRLVFRYLIAQGRHGLAYELLYKAKVFDDYVYVFHGEQGSAAAAFLRKELPKFFVRQFWAGRGENSGCPTPLF